MSFLGSIRWRQVSKRASLSRCHRPSVAPVCEPLEFRRFLTAVLEAAPANATVSEGGTVTYGVSFSKPITGQARSPISVGYRIDGSATSGVDHGGSEEGSILVTWNYPFTPYGGGSITIPVYRDNVIDGTETFTVTLLPSTDGSYTLEGSTNPNARTSSTFTIPDDPPKVTIHTVDGTATEPVTGQPLDTGIVRLVRSGGNIDEALPVWIRQDSTTGYANETVDYANIPDAQMFAAGSSTLDIVVTPLDDLDPEGPEDVVTMLWNPGWGPYLIEELGENKSWAKVTILDDGEDGGLLLPSNGSDTLLDADREHDRATLDLLLA